MCQEKYQIVRYCPAGIFIFILLTIILGYEHVTPPRVIGYLNQSYFPKNVTLPYTLNITAVLTGDKSVSGQIILGKDTNNIWWSFLHPDTIDLGLCFKANSKVKISIYRNEQKIALSKIENSSSCNKVLFRLFRADLLSLGINDFTIVFSGPVGERIDIFKTDDDVYDNYKCPKVKVFEHMSGAEAIWRWFQFSRVQGFLFVVIVLFLSIASSFKKISNRCFIASVICILVGYAYLSPVLSGNDETAHIDIFYRSLRGSPECNGAVDCPHFKTVANYMISRGFYNLHKVDVQPANQPPHFILKLEGQAPTSGYDAGVMRYCNNLIMLANFFGVTYRSSPEVVSFFVRTFNLLLFVVLFVFFCWRSPLSVIFAMGLLIIMNGGILSQIGSISNDIPFYFIGTLLSFVIIKQLYSKEILPVCIFIVLIIIFMIFFLRRIDDSWIAISPGLVFAIIVLISRVKNKIYCYYIPCLTAIIIIIIYFMFTNMTFNSFVGNFVKQYTSRYHHIFLLKNMSILEVINILKYHFSSLVGSYVWGHSFYPKYVIVFLSIMYAVYIVNAFGVCHGSSELCRAINIIVVDGYLASLILYVFIVIIVADVNAGKTLMYAMCNVRFVASSSFLLLIPAAVATMLLVDSNNWMGYVAVRFVLCSFSLLIGVYMIQFYFVDLL